MSDLTQLDGNKDLQITSSELFRDKVIFCCQDIGTTVLLTVLVTDMSGNTSRAEIGVFVDAKLEWTACDDQDDCTENDRQYGDCPCMGTPVIEDIDGDLIIDCTDETITICLDDRQKEIPRDSVDYYLSQGAVGGPCQNGEMADIGGIVYTNRNERVEDVLITLNEEKQVITSLSGTYMFEKNVMYERYELYPERNDDPVNGVSTLDVVLIQDYILGLQSIDDPYDLIAADVNNDGNITALDIVEIRKLLLGQIDGFSNNKSWRFVLEQFEFNDYRRPFDYQEIDVISNLLKDEMDENWIGVKIGDVNGTVIANSNKSNQRSREEWTVDVPEMEVREGDEIKIPFSINSFAAIRGLQMGIRLDGLEFTAMESAELAIQSAQFATREHRFSTDLSVVWHDKSIVDIEKNLFIIEVKATRTGQLSDMISLENRLPVSLVSLPDFREIPVELYFTDDHSISAERNATLHQNQPNPFNGETIIQFFIPEADNVIISFYDGSGSLLYEVENFYNKGINAIRLTHGDLSLFEGVVFYQLEYRDQLLSRKMVLSK